MSKTIPVMEIFGPTIQGEGAMTGKLTHFIRTGGCGLRCTWCDSLDAVLPERVNANAMRITPEQIAEVIGRQPYAPWVTLTGGDPCMHKGLGDVIHILNGDRRGRYVAVETQGQLFPDWLKECDQITFSPKGPSSGKVMDVDPLAQYLEELITGHDYKGSVCIKIVSSGPEDITYAQAVHDKLSPNTYHSFWLSAMSATEGTTGEVWDLMRPHRDIAVLKGYRMLGGAAMNMLRMQRTHKDPRLIQSSDIHPMWKDPRLHIGCQQHALLWPEQLEGV